MASHAGGAAGGGGVPSGGAFTTTLLKRQFQELTKNPPEGVSVGLKDDNLFHWTVMIVGPAGTSCEGGFFRAELKFPESFPNHPPDMYFLSEMWHPNIFPDGKVCISILHPPGVDEQNSQETADERWRPILGVESVLLSVISMLGDPNPDSPANVDAGKMFREDPKAFKRRVRRCVERSLEQ